MNRAKQKPRSNAGGKKSSLSWRDRLRAYFLSHMQAMMFSLGQISRTPFSSLMTVSVIGIALALPTGLHVVLKNVQGLTSNWEQAAQITVFLEQDLIDRRIKQVTNLLDVMEEVESTQLITPTQALREFEEYSNFADALGLLTENPLPTVLVVQPAVQYVTPDAVGLLLLKLKQIDGVDQVQLDMEWVKRLHALMEIGKRGVLVLASLLGLSVLLVVGNTIRLAIQSRRDEIEVQKLIGATDSFIRRPFLYHGFWQGLLGACVAWFFVALALQLLSGPVAQLSMLYNSYFELGSLGFMSGVVLIGISVVLGLLGARMAVGRHLRDIEPS